MPFNTQGYANIPAGGRNPANSRFNQRTRKNKPNIGQRFGRFIKTIKNKLRVIPEAIEKSAEKSIFSRKIVWLDKIEQYLTIATCTIRLKLHLYCSKDDRASLKRTIADSRTQLNILNGKEVRQNNYAEAKEDFKDGRYVDGLRKAGQAAVGGAKELGNRFVAAL